MTRAAPWLCAGLHVLSLAALALFLGGGTEFEGRSTAARRTVLMALFWRRA